MFRRIKLFSLGKTVNLEGLFSAHGALCPKSLSTTSTTHGVHASLKVQDGIGVVMLDSPGKVNVLHLESSKEMEDIFSEIQKSSSIVGGVLISRKPSCFIAGADINMFEEITTVERGKELSKYTQQFFMSIEKSKKPFVAAIMGACMGGGLETALACHYRLAVRDKCKFSLPEVMLGILPGAGGTQRLPKLIGLPNALDMLLTGKNITTEKAKSFGLIDSIVESLGPGLEDSDQRTLHYLEDIAIETTRQIATGDLKIKRQPKGLYNIAVKTLFDTKLARNYIFKEAKRKVLRQTNGLYPAPLRILDVTREGLEKGERAGYESEAQSFGELVVSSEAHGLISLFHGMNKCKENTLGKSEVNSVAVLGAGLMGAGIAYVSLRKGYRTILNDISIKSLVSGQSQIEKILKKSLKRKTISKLDKEKYLSNLVLATDYSKFSNVDIVIEAIFEDLDIKRKVLKDVENATSENCVYATNTSALSIKDIAKFSKRPEKVLGMHYFSPVDKMQLLEIITTDATSKETLKTAVSFGLKQGKVPIIVKDSPGFYTTRILMPLIVEGFKLMCEGVDPKVLDSLCKDIGFPIGIVTLSDEVGIDVGFHVYCYFIDIFGERIKSVDPNLGREITEAGILGRKTGKGSYIYKKNSKEKLVNQEALDIIQKFRTEPKIPLTNENIKFRILSRFVNEAAMCLQEGVLSNPVDGDIGAVFGLGFPPFTGGPFRYIDSFGAGKLVNQMRTIESEYGPSFTPCQLLVDHAKDSSKRFYK